jgi:hypothetical protein
VDFFFLPPWALRHSAPACLCAVMYAIFGCARRISAVRARFNMLTYDQMEQLLIEHKQLVVNQHWGILKENWSTMEAGKYHHTKVKQILGIQTIKQHIADQIGYIGPYIFLNEFFSRYDWVLPYHNIEKGLLLIYHLLTSNSYAEMGQYIPQSSFLELHNNLFKKKYHEFDQWLDEKLLNMFSSPEIHILCA